MPQQKIHDDHAARSRAYRQRQKLTRLQPLTSLFPYHGGKAQVADVIWQHLGDVRHYVEPFAGSLATLLARPHPPRVETVNDLDGHIVNVWRALAADPAAVVHYARWPVSSNDLWARHDELCRKRASLTTQLQDDPRVYDAELAGYWVYARSCWAGASGFGRTPGQRPMPLLTHTGNGVHAIKRRASLLRLCRDLQVRLQDVRLLCHDWQECLTTPRLFGVGGTVGILLDPPYTQARREQQLYAVPDTPASAVRDWAIAHGDDPRLRLALCGLDGEHQMPDTWQGYHWQARGGWANTAAHGRGSGTTRQEVVWFSPHCLRPTEPALQTIEQLPLDV
jgi:DNA adenine methylase